MTAIEIEVPGEIVVIVIAAITTLVITILLARHR
jgi:hypothetical protein